MRKLLTVFIFAAAASLTGLRGQALGQEAQRPVSLKEALTFFAQRSPQLQLARTRLRIATGAATQSRALPNPVMSVTHEAPGEYSESYLNLTQRVDFLWESGARRDRAGALASQAREVFRADSARLALEVKRAHLAAWEERLNTRAVQAAGAIMDQMVAAAETRFREGDLAGYDVRRLRLEHVRYQRRLLSHELRLEAAERRLGTLLSSTDDSPRIAATDPETLPPIMTIGEDPVTRALAQRPEVEAARNALASARAEAGLAGRSLLSGTALTGGFKRQSDGAEGLFVGIEVPLPLADRRGPARQAATAAVDGADHQMELVRRSITQEVVMAVTALESLRQQQLITPVDVGDSEELLIIARLGYEEGEIGIVDLLDATNTYLETSLEGIRSRARLWEAHFELEHAMGGLESGTQNGAIDR